MKNNNFTENEIRPADLMELKKPALEHDKEYLRQRKSNFVKVNCVACGSTNYSFWAEKEGFSYDICNNCRTIFMNPRADEALLNEFYKHSKNYKFWNKYIFPKTNEIRKEKIFRPRAEKTVEFCRKFGVEKDTFLEIGAAYGTFCELIKDTSLFKRVIAVEPTPDLADTCRKKGIETFETTIEELNLPQKSVDVISNFEVIEHLFNPSEFIEKASYFLKKGGLFICTCPNGKSIGTIVLKEKANFIDHEHVNYFNPESLSSLLINKGFEIMEVSTPGKLDAEILKNYFKENPDSKQNLLNYILLENFENLEEIFQKFITEAKISSNMWIVARKNEL